MSISVCPSCENECSTVGIKDGFHYDYGEICGAWHDESYEGSDCCGEVAFEGRVSVTRSTHTAIKDHYNQHGKLVVKKGDRYRKFYKVGWYVDDDGKRHGIKSIKKIPAPERISHTRQQAVSHTEGGR